MILSKLKILNKAEILDIHEASLKILEDTGIKIQSDKVLDFLDTFNGVKTDKEKKIAKFSKSIAEQCVQKAPSSFNIYSQDKRESIKVGGNNYYMINGHCSAFIHDSNTGKRRRALKEDVKDFAILCDNMDEVEIIGIEAIPSDVIDQRYSFISGANITLVNTNKPFHYTPEFIFENDAVLGFVRILTGKTDLSEKPSILGQATNISPLAWPKEISEILLSNSLLGIPMIIITSPYSGVSAPITMAGQIAMFNAEILSGIIINKLANPKSGVVYGCSCATFDMRESVTNIATPETSLMRIAVSQMAKFYGLPSFSSGPDSDSNIHDEQNGWEKMITTFMPFASGLNIIVNGGLYSTGTEVSLEQIVLDCEIKGYVKRLLRGFKVDEEKLAVKAINDTGPLGNFIIHDHTLRNLRTKEHRIPFVSNRMMYSKWESRGSKDISEVAKEKALEIIGMPRHAYYDAKKIKEIDDLVSKIIKNET